jgi:hypothetical protein
MKDIANANPRHNRHKRIPEFALVNARGGV